MFRVGFHRYDEKDGGACELRNDLLGTGGGHAFSSVRAQVTRWTHFHTRHCVAYPERFAHNQSCVNGSTHTTRPLLVAAERPRGGCQIARPSQSLRCCLRDAYPSIIACVDRDKRRSLRVDGVSFTNAIGLLG